METPSVTCVRLCKENVDKQDINTFTPSWGQYRQLPLFDFFFALQVADGQQACLRAPCVVDFSAGNIYQTLERKINIPYHDLEV